MLPVVTVPNVRMPRILITLVVFEAAPPRWLHAHPWLAAGRALMVPLLLWLARRFESAHP